MRSKLAPTIIAAAGLLLITSCSTNTTEGEASTSIETEPVAAELDTGEWPTAPREAFTTAKTPEAGRIVEGQRMAEFILLPTDLDPLLTKQTTESTGILSTPAALNFVTIGQIAPVAEREDMVMGFATARGYEDRNSQNTLIHAVLRFPDAEAAKRAARDMSIGTRAPARGEGAVPTPISILPETHVTSDIAPGGSNDYNSYGFTARGNYVIYTAAGTTVDTKDWAAQMIAKGLEQQGPMIDAFPATPVQELATMPVDIDDLLVYAVVDKENRTSQGQGVYGPRGSAHYSANPALTMAHFAATGTTLMATDGANVYRSKDENGAKKLFDLYAGQAITIDGFAGSAPLAGVPNSKCFAKDTADGELSYCLVQNGRHVAEISGVEDETNVRQKASAQYLILNPAT